MSSDFAFITGAGQVGEGSDWAFEEASPGDVSSVFETKQAFYMLELIELREEGYISLQDATASIEQEIMTREKLNMAKLQGSEMVEEIRAGNSIYDVAKKYDLEIRDAGPYNRMDFVPGLGRMNAAVGAGFGLYQGQVSNVVEANNKAFIIELADYIAADTTVFEEMRANQRSQMIANLQQTRLQDWLQDIRNSASIVDRRNEVLNADPSDQQPTMPLVF